MTEVRVFSCVSVLFPLAITFESGLAFSCFLHETWGISDFPLSVLQQSGGNTPAHSDTHSHTSRRRFLTAFQQDSRLLFLAKMLLHYALRSFNCQSFVQVCFAASYVWYMSLPAQLVLEVIGVLALMIHLSHCALRYAALKDWNRELLLATLTIYNLCSFLITFPSLQDVQYWIM